MIECYSHYHSVQSLRKNLEVVKAPNKQNSLALEYLFPRRITESFPKQQTNSICRRRPRKLKYAKTGFVLGGK